MHRAGVKLTYLNRCYVVGRHLWSACVAATVRYQLSSASTGLNSKLHKYVWWDRTQQCRTIRHNLVGLLEGRKLVLR